jgi:hypothetical protein
MTVLLVLFLFLAFVGTDHLVRMASRRAATRREKPSRVATPPYPILTKRPIG